MDRTRLVHLLGLLGSDSAGERDTAGKMAHEIVKSSGRSWNEIIEPANAEETLSLASELMARSWPVVASIGIAANLRPQREGEVLNIAGWSDGRWGQLFDWCNRSNYQDITELKSQLDYLSYSLRGPYAVLGAKLTGAKSVSEATKLFKKYTGDAKEFIT